MVVEVHVADTKLSMYINQIMASKSEAIFAYIVYQILLIK